ncbi:hypothetical protein ACPPVV_02045 [Rhodanobacter sp. Col0626]|uniref:hypothetical protein n=1 Tax=Rhodanobacter sp. Col0626 TaxID=3415679 RepID=UPI003CF2F395
MTHGDPKNPKMNPHPVKRYEVIATADAPGPWDSVKGYISYDVINPACTPEDKFLGVHEMPQDVGQDIEMTRINEKTWKGYFYRDLIQDEDYYELGVCHWDATSVAAVFTVHNEKFAAGSAMKDFTHNGPQMEYFRKSDFLDRSRTIDGLPYLTVRPEYIKSPDAFFPITVTVKEATL